MLRVLSGFILIIGVSVHAQAITTSVAQQGGVAVTSPLERKISLDLTDVSLDKAVDEISSKANVRIVYVKDQLASKPRVTVRNESITAGNALNQVLRGTGLVLSSYSGALAIVERTVMSKKSSRSVIAGKITDAKSGRGISGANISLDSDGRGVVSDEDGLYRMSGVSVGNHTVSVRLVGYAKQTRSITIGDGITVTVDFRLEPSANILNDVIVTGTIISTELKAVPSAITVITAKQIEERGITRIDQLFRGDIPGLFSSNRGSGASLDDVTMFSRGASAFPFAGSAGVDLATGNTNPIKTYIDGIELADPKYLSQIDPNSIERIEILTGPQASTIYGANAINGVMQIFTKRGSSSRLHLTLNLLTGIAQNDFSSHLSPDHRIDMVASGTDGKWSYSIGGSWNYLGSWTPSKQTQRLSYNGGARAEWSKLTADINARQGLTQNRQNGDKSQSFTFLKATGVWLLTGDAGLPTPQAQKLNGHTFGFSLNYHPFSWWSHQLVAGSDVSATETAITSPKFIPDVFGGDTTLSINPASTYRTSQNYTTTVQVPIASLATVSFVMGGDHWRTKGFSWSASPLVLVGSNIGQSFGRTHPSKNAGAYVQGQLSIMNILFLTYGIRSDWNPNFGEKAKVLPGRYGISMTNDMGPVSVKFRGSYGRSIRPPNTALTLASPNTNLSRLAQFGPFDIRLANPDLGPEDRRGGEGGVELYVGSRGSLIVTRFNETTNNLISQVSNVDSVPSLLPVAPSTTNCGFNAADGITFDAQGRCFRYQSQNLNVGSIRNQGWELQNSINIGPLTTRGTYSWVKSRVIGITPRYKALLTGSQFQTGSPFDYMPEHTWALGVTYAQSSNTVSLSFNGIGALYSSFDELTMLASAQSRLTGSRPRISLVNYRVLNSGYTTLDLNGTHRFSSRVETLLQINNLTNYYNNDFSGALATIGRQTHIGARVRF